MSERENLRKHGTDVEKDKHERRRKKKRRRKIDEERKKKRKKRRKKGGGGGGGLRFDCSPKRLQRSLLVAWLVPRETAAASVQVLCGPYSRALIYSVTLLEETYVGCMCV